jgi:hypothetical protein
LHLAAGSCQKIISSARPLDRHKYFHKKAPHRAVPLCDGFPPRTIPTRSLVSRSRAVEQVAASRKEQTHELH